MVKVEDDDGSYALPPFSSSSVISEEPAHPHISTASIYISNMSARLESTTSVKQWESERKREVEGTPPRPEDHPSTIEGEARRATIRGITPSYKTGDGKANYDLTLGQSGHLPNASGDYKMKQSMEHYKQTIIDPLVRSNATIPTPLIPDPRLPVGDFASEHSRRIFKSEPLEQKTFKSSTTRPITTSDYLTKSIDRHRDMEASRLRDLLKAKESDANQPWNKPGWPGPKPNDDEKMRELEHMKKSIERLERKIHHSSTPDISIPPPPDVPNIEEGDPGWVIRRRAYKISSMDRHKSLEHLHRECISPPPGQLRVFKSIGNQEIDGPPSSSRASSSQGPRRDEGPMWSDAPDEESLLVERNGGHDPSTHSDQSDREAEERAYSVQQLRTAYLERVREESRAARRYTPTLDRRPLEGIPEEDRRSAPPPPAAPPVQQQQQQYSVSSSEVRQYQQQRHEQHSNQAYPQYDPAPPRNQYTVQPPVSLSLRVDQSQSRQQEDYPVRLMSPTPSSQQPPQQQQPVQHPRPILKQSRPQQPQSNGGYEMRAPSFRDMSEDERRAIMQENLMKQRARPMSTTPRAPEVSFNGPFFELQEVNGHGGRRVSMTPSQSAQQDYEAEIARREHLERSRQMSASEMELDRAATVVIWPPTDPRERPRSQSVMARSVTDPERIEEFRRQRELEAFHLRREEDNKRRAYEKQIRATEIQQQYLYEQKLGMRSPVPLSGAPVGAATPSDIYHRPPQYSQQQQKAPPPPPPMSNGGSRYTPSHLNHADRSYTQQDPHAVPPEDLRVYETRPLSPSIREEMVSPNGTSWKRTYILQTPDDVAKNEILTSDDLLARDQFDIDLLKRREAFVPKPDQPKEIFRTGRRWAPPPDQPYVWPQLRQPISVEADMSPRDFKPGAPDGDEYQWEPVTHDPQFKRERKNFTPDHSPPRPRKGGGTGPLDEPARRQTKYLVQPSPDGSHRPKPAFKAARNAPQGGFYPHAPNSIKVIKHRSVNDGLLQTQEEIIHEKPSFKVVNGDRIGSRASRRDHQEEVIHDWEKIYDLPPHSSTLVNKEVPRRVDVGKRLAAFENGIHHDIHRRNSAPASRSASVQPRLTVRTSTRGELSRPDSAASSALLSPIPRGDEPKAERVRHRMNSIAAISPTPPSYDRARSYQPPALPPGYREAAKPKKNDDLDELRREREELLERSRRNRNGYTATDSELIKKGPEPVPAYFKEHVREMLESRASIDTAKTKEDDAKSGYVTDVSSATWQFSTHSFSPRSVVSVNGGTQDDGLLKVRVDTEEPTKSIMKRRELESREDMMGAGKEIAVHRDYQRSHSSMSAKPRVTQTVQRFEEHKRTEEIERRVQRKERRERRTRHEWSESGRHQGGASSAPLTPRIIYERRQWTPEELNGAVRHAYRCVDQAYREIRHRSNSMSRHNYAIGYHPTQESHWHQESTRRGHNGFQEGGLAHARYGSLSDSLRRGELKYVPNGEVRESFYGQNGGGQRMHKSYSTRDVFNGGFEDGRSSWRRGSPFVEYPPTLPRHADSRSEYRPVSKSRSYADWDDRERSRRRGDDQLSRLENEFRDASLLVPANMGGGPVNHREHRTEQIPGGYETYHKEMKGDQGRRVGRDGRPVDFSEQSTEYSFKREVDGRH